MTVKFPEQLRKKPCRQAECCLTCSRQKDHEACSTITDKEKAGKVCDNWKQMEVLTITPEMTACVAEIEKRININGEVQVFVKTFDGTGFPFLPQPPQIKCALRTGFVFLVMDVLTLDVEVIRATFWSKLFENSLRSRGCCDKEWREHVMPTKYLNIERKKLKEEQRRKERRRESNYRDYIDGGGMG